MNYNIQAIIDEMSTREEAYAQEAADLIDDGDYDEMLDEVYDQIEIGVSLNPSDVLKQCDPVAYNLGNQEYQDRVYADAESEFNDEYRYREQLQQVLDELNIDQKYLSEIYERLR